jgi:hypothetical protein
MSKRRFPWIRSILIIFILIGAGAAFRFGLVPARYSPLPRIALASPGTMLIDWQLAEMKHEPQLCREVLTAPQIEASPISDSPIKNGCGWENAFRISKAGGARISVEKVTCEVATAFTLWMEHAVQPAAQEIFGVRVASVGNFGTYACRNIVGNPHWSELRSEHATANAIDVASFTLTDGRTISVERNWKGTGPESRFLHAAHRGSCKYFRVALGPDFNEAHHNHFHLDRGILWTCR